MGQKNYIIEGVSGTGKTAVANELARRGYHVVHGDRELKYRGDPETGKKLDEPEHANDYDKTLWRQQHHCWDVDKVKAIVTDHAEPVSFFCGGTRNFHLFSGYLDGVFILDVADIDEIFRRLDERVSRDPTDFGGKPEEKKIVARMHRTKEDIPRDGIVIDARQSLMHVVDEILSHCSC